MSDLEKTNIYLPAEVSELLDRDARAFEIFMKDKISINRNKLLNKVLYGYYTAYTEHYNSDILTITSVLKDYFVHEKKAVEAADLILKNLLLPLPPKKKGKYSSKISLKPVKYTESIVKAINDDPKNDSLSQYYARMLISYAAKPVYEREKIVFLAHYEALERHCAQKTLVSFNTTWNPKIVHTVLPYKIVPSKEEMYNYLLCQEYNPVTKRYETATYRLCRIEGINSVFGTQSFDEKVLGYLKRMEVSGPQYSINSDEPVIVKLNEEGVRQYNRIYNNRPIYTEDPVKGENNLTTFIFDCSEWQAYLYFRRFRPGSYSIVQPASLKEQLIRHFSEALSALTGED